MIIVSGSLSVEPAARDGYVVSCGPIVEQARAAPGCLDFALSSDAVDPGRVNVYERWESEKDLEAFRGTGPEPEQRVQIQEAQVHKYRVSAVEQP